MCSLYSVTFLSLKVFGSFGCLTITSKSSRAFPSLLSKINIPDSNGSKVRRGKYSVRLSDNTLFEDINDYISDDQEAVTRLVSSNLRHGCDVGFIVHQLEKTKGDLQSFSKALSRVLKKYIKDGTKISGESCEKCGGALIRMEGCVSCESCSWTKCS